MTEKKIESLFNEAIVIGDKLEQNLNRFDKSNDEIKRIYGHLSQLNHVIQQISMYGEENKQKEAQRFAQQIKEQVDKYYSVLQEVDLDTTVIEELITDYNQTIQKQANKLEENASVISETLQTHGEAIVAAAQTIKRGKRSVFGSIMLFTSGTVLGALFLAAYPIAAAAKYFHDELLIRDSKIQQLKEQYETNNKTLRFLRKYNITIRNGRTDDSWHREGLSYHPMILFDKKRVKRMDEINGYSRIIFSKPKNRN